MYTLPNLDINYLMKSSMAISAEIEEDTLLKKIMQVVIGPSECDPLECPKPCFGC